MQINEEIKEAVSRLSTRNLEFLEFAQRNPACLDRSNFKLLELKDDLFVLQPWPTFVHRGNINHFKTVALKMWRLIKAIPRRVFENDYEKMAQFYEVPISTIEYRFQGVSDEHLENLMGRGDFILSPTGLKCVEYNFSASLGGWQIPIWESLYLNTPLIARFFKENGVKHENENLIRHFLEHVVNSAPADIFKNEGKFDLAVVWDGFVDGKIATQSYLNMLFKNILQQKGDRLGGRVHMCAYKDLEITDGFIFHKGEKIHTLVELHRGFVPEEIMAVFKVGNIRLINGPVSRVLANKLNLALLSNHESMNVFDAEEKDFIDRYVPWTRKIMPGPTRFAGKTINLPDFIRDHQEKFVIKPGDQYGGKGVCVGIKATHEEWQEAVETAIKEKNWAAQEYVESSPGFYQTGVNDCDIHDMSWGFFLFGNRYAGEWVRVLPQKNNRGVVNCHQGASVSVVFNVNEFEE